MGVWTAKGARGGGGCSVDESRHKDDTKPLSERELEGNKLELESAKTQVLISSGLLVGLAAVVGIFANS
jgi:hypothetical protein